MANRTPKTFDSVAKCISAFLKEFQAETDRGTALVAAAYLEDLLGAMLRKHFIEHSKEVDELLEGNGPLGTFSSRITLTYCLGLIRDDQFKDLNTVRKIRNASAHSHQTLDFSREPISNLAANLNQIKLISKYRDAMTPEDRDILIDNIKPTARNL